MENNTFEPLFNKAKEKEKKYEWSQAAEYYKKISDLASKEKDEKKIAEFQERIGFCFYRSAFQANTNVEYRRRMKQAIKTYEKEDKRLQETGKEKNQVRIDHINALVSYVRSWLETNPLKKKELLNSSLTLEKKVLAAYESVGDLHSIGESCNQITNYLYSLFWLISGFSEKIKNKKDGSYFAEKAIQTLSKLNDASELAEAYRSAVWNNLKYDQIKISDEKTREMIRKTQNFVNKSLEVSKKSGEARLISRSYMTAWNFAQYFLFKPTLAIEYSMQSIKYGTIAKDNFSIAMGNCFSAHTMVLLAKFSEDPDEQKESFKKAKKMATEAITKGLIFSDAPILMISYPQYAEAIAGLASIETDTGTKQAFFETSIKVLKEGIEHLKDRTNLLTVLFISLSETLLSFSKTKNEIEEKRKLLNEAKIYDNKVNSILKGSSAMNILAHSRSKYRLSSINKELAKIETDKSEKNELLNKAIGFIETSIGMMEKGREFVQSDWTSGSSFGPYYEEFGRLLQQVHSLTNEEKQLRKAIEAHKKASFEFKKANLHTSEAESYWQIAQLHGQMEEHQEASKNYDLAAETYDLVPKKIPQLKNFYENYSIYMQSWSKIEQARYFHSIEDYVKAKEHYEKAAELHTSTEPWSYLAPNYFAWAKMEEAESLSRKESTQQAKQAFQKAIDQFIEAENSIKQKIGAITSADEKEMTQRLQNAVDLRRKFCQARILLEEAKLQDRKGKYLQSSISYKEAAKTIETIAEQLESVTERKELKLIAILSQAWEKMAIANETTSSESYLEAATLFEKAKELSKTKKTSLWALGNSSFCKGLAAGTRYQESMDLRENAMAKRHIKSAATSYLQAGFKNASEYAKATLRLFDAYVFMNQAESEVNPEKKSKQYLMAENLLQISAGLFMKAKQPEKTSQVQQILKMVREEKTLAVSLNEVMQAPTISSSTLSFAALTPSNEVSVGLESFQHANVQANLIAGVREVKVGESFCLTVEFVNAGKEPALLIRVEEFIPKDFVVVRKPEFFRIEDNSVNMKGKQLASLKFVEAKLVLQPCRKGLYRLNPKVHYLDELGQKKSLELKSIEIKVEEVVLEDRIPTGTIELDSLLLGGIPKEYAVVLTGPPSDERQLIINNFLHTKIKEKKTTLLITTEVDGLEHLLENPNFYLFLCNPKPKNKVPDLPNICKLRGKTDLTNLSIALAKVHRKIDQTLGPKRVCVEIVSDVLVNYGTKTTRKWISELITDLGPKGFTMLAVMNPSMHPSDQANAVIDLFDGEISISQTEDPLECKKSIRVKKLRNQEYIKNPICLTKHTWIFDYI